MAEGIWQQNAELRVVPDAAAAFMRPISAASLLRCKT
jgi:hypothetical protein